MNRKALRPNLQVAEEASTWFVAFRSQDLGESARRDFHDWLKLSPEHIRVYLEIASVYADIPAPEQGYTPPELLARAKLSPDINVLSMNPGEITVESLKRPRAPIDNPQGVGHRLFIPRAILAASILVFAFVGAWLYADRNIYRTSIGEQRAITLSDSSIVELNARSKVRVDFDERQRDVELLEGQALFRVAKDANRPFVVHAGATSVRAVGTQFDVYRKRTGTTVTVIEGRVAILSRTSESGQTAGAVTQPVVPEAPAAAPARKVQADSKVSIPAPTTRLSSEGGLLLTAGEQMTVTPTHAHRSEHPNIAAATAWTRHQLVFDGTPLSEVVDEFSRYTTRRLIIDSPALANLKISGQYMSTSPDSLLRFLSLQEGVVITEVNGETHIRQE